jgi:hypothetical protein
MEKNERFIIRCGVFAASERAGRAIIDFTTGPLPELPVADEGDEKLRRRRFPDVVDSKEGTSEATGRKT